jgi:Cap4 SAVED domain
MKATVSRDEGPQDEISDLKEALAALRRDYSKLAPRLRCLEHSITCESEGVVLRLHFPAFRQGKATIPELVDAIIHFLIPFALPRSAIKAVDDLYGKVDVDEFKSKISHLSETAKALFKRANEATNRNGEAGELILYLLTEWVLSAPQLIAKMSLKTNRDMPVHGADGVHVRYSPDDSRLLLYWGESKLYSDLSDAISAAVTSISEALQPEKMQHEIDLVQRNIDFSGLDAAAKQAILRYLDPYDEAYNERHDVTTCLIGFDFNAFDDVSSTDPAQAEANFINLAKAALNGLAPKLAKSISTAKLVGRPIEIFFFPVPSVQQLRDLFQVKIGWKL